jgi:hypothetical protein
MREDSYHMDSPYPGLRPELDLYNVAGRRNGANSVTICAVPVNYVSRIVFEKN